MCVRVNVCTSSLCVSNKNFKEKKMHPWRVRYAYSTKCPLTLPDLHLDSFNYEEKSSYPIGWHSGESIGKRE